MHCRSTVKNSFWNTLLILLPNGEPSMNASVKRTLCLVAGGLLIVYLALWKLILPLGLNKAIPLIEQTAGDYINGQVQLEQVEVSPDLTFTAKNMVLLDQHKKIVAEIPGLSLYLDPLQFVMGKGTIGMVNRIAVHQPKVYLRQEKSGTWNVATLLKESQSSSTSFTGDIVIDGGALQVETPYGSWNLGVTGNVDSSRNPVFGLDLTATYEGKDVHITGSMDTDKKGSLTAKSTVLDLTPISRLAQHFLPVKELKGQLRAASVTWTNNDRGSYLSGEAVLEQVAASYTYQGDTFALTANGSVQFDNQLFSTGGLDVTVNGQKAHLSGTLDLNSIEHPYADRFQIQLQQVSLGKLGLGLPMNGIVTGQVQVTGTLDNLTGKGRFTSDAVSFGGYTAENITLPLTFSGHRVETEGAAAQIGGGSVLVKASFDWKKMDGVLSVAADQVDAGTFYPRLGQVVLDGTLYASLAYQDGLLRGETVSSDMRLIWGELLLKEIALDGTFDGKDVQLTRLAAKNDNGEGGLTGSASLVNDNVNAELYLTDLPISPVLALFGQQGSGRLSTHLMMRGTDTDPDVWGAFSLKHGNLLGMPVDEAHGALEWQHHVLSLHKVEMTPNQGRHELDGSINLSGNEPVLHVTLITTGVRLEPLAGMLQAPVKITGNLTNTITVQGPLSNPSFRGHVHAYDGSVKDYLVDEVSGDYAYDGQILTLENVKVQSLGCSAQVAGTIGRDGTLDVGIDAQNVNLKRLYFLQQDMNLLGLVNFNGHIGGTVKRPQISGVLTSDSIKVNGEEFTGLALSFRSDGGHINEIEGTGQQTSGGDYRANIRFDTDQMLLQWDVKVEQGNIQSLLKMAGYNLDVQGFLTGEIKLNEKGKDTGMTVIGQVDNGAVRNVPFSSANFDFFVRHGNWQINKLQAQEAGGGLIAAAGNVDLWHRTIDLEVDTSEANAKILTLPFDEPPLLEGKVNTAAQFKGNLDHPDGNISVELVDGSLSGVVFDHVYGMAHLRNDMLTLDQALIQKDVYKITAYGTFPVDLLRSSQKRTNPNAQMDLEIRMDNGNLAILPSLTNYIQWADGPLKGGLTITGTLENYAMNGSVDLDGGTIKAKGLNDTFDNVSLHAVFAGQTMLLKELSATMGSRGKIQAQGSYLLHDFSDRPYQLTGQVQDLELNAPNLKGKINGNFTIEQKEGIPFVKGQVKLDKFAWTVSSIPEFGEGGSKIGLDVDVDLGDDLRIYNAAFFNLGLNGKFHLSGDTAFPVVQGNISVNKGSTLKYLGTPFNITRGELSWPYPGTFTPTVNLTAFTRMGQYIILCKAQGPLNLDDLVITLTSDPPQSQETLKRILTLKTDDPNAQLSVSNLVDAGLQMTFLADVEDAIKDALGLDELRIYSGTMQNGVGFSADAEETNQATGQDRQQYNVLLSRRFGKLMVGYTASFNGQKSNAFVGYPINRQMFLGISMNQDHEFWYGLQYRKSF